MSRPRAGDISILVRQVATGSDVRVVEPQSTPLAGLSFSPDGQYLYYVVSKGMRRSPPRCSPSRRSVDHPGRSRGTSSRRWPFLPTGSGSHLSGFRHRTTISSCCSTRHHARSASWQPSRARPMTSAVAWRGRTTAGVSLRCSTRRQDRIPETRAPSPSTSTPAPLRQSPHGQGFPRRASRGCRGKTPRRRVRPRREQRLSAVAASRSRQGGGAASRAIRVLTSAPAHRPMARQPPRSG